MEPRPAVPGSEGRAEGAPHRIGAGCDQGRGSAEVNGLPYYWILLADGRTTVPAPDYNAWADWIRLAICSGRLEIATTWLDAQGRMLPAPPVVNGWEGSRYMPPGRTVCVATTFDGINHGRSAGDLAAPFATDVTGLPDDTQGSWYWTSRAEAEAGHARHPGRSGSDLPSGGRLLLHVQLIAVVIGEHVFHVHVVRAVRRCVLVVPRDLLQRAIREIHVVHGTFRPEAAGRTVPCGPAVATLILRFRSLRLELGPRWWRDQKVRRVRLPDRLRPGATPSPGCALLGPFLTGRGR